MEKKAQAPAPPDIDRLAKLYIEPTNRCNLDCRTCMRHGWEEPLGYMEFGLFETIMAEVRSFPQRPDVFFGGFGEPLGHPRIADMVASAKAVGGEVELISNGILLDEALARRLIAAGLDRIWISIDGSSPASYADIRLGDHLPEIIANLESLQKMKRRPELGISFVAMKRNIADLPAVLELAKRLGASLFSLSNVEPYTEEMAREVLYGRVLFAALPAGGCVMPRFDLNVIAGEMLEKVSALFPAALAFTPLAREHEGMCPFLQRRSASVRWDGQVGPCLPLLHGHAVFPNGHSRNWPEFHFGSLREFSVAELWNSDAWKDFRIKLDEFVFAPCSTCNSCDLPDINNEDCYGNVHPACGGCLWSQGFIQCP
jgi:MoaA/NifB/PqqE/SkfB family radical SAM enzyme